jgi:hypothetical protein
MELAMPDPDGGIDKNFPVIDTLGYSPTPPN